jgi:hypothetical protein
MSEVQAALSAKAEAQEEAREAAARDQEAIAELTAARQAVAQTRSACKVLRYHATSQDEAVARTAAALAVEELARVEVSHPMSADQLMFPSHVAVCKRSSRVTRTGRQRRTSCAQTGNLRAHCQVVYVAEDAGLTLNRPRRLSQRRRRTQRRSRPRPKRTPSSSWSGRPTRPP